VSLRAGRVHVRIEQEEYKRLKAYFLDLSCRRTVPTLWAEFRAVPFVPFAPVRQRLLCIWRAVNRKRKTAGYQGLSVEWVPWRRPVVRPFEQAEGRVRDAA